MGINCRIFKQFQYFSNPLTSLASDLLFPLDMKEEKENIDKGKKLDCKYD